jgi:hypothetical protein
MDTRRWKRSIVSLLSSDRVRLFLSPTQIVVIDSDNAVDFRSSDSAMPSDGPAVYGLAENLAGALSAIFEKRNASVVDWVLSNHFVRYAVAPWSSDLKRGAEDRVWLGIAFEEQYGKSLPHFEFLASPNGFGRNRLAAAISTALLHELRKATTNSGKIVHSIEPLLMVQINQWRTRFPEGRCFFAVAEAGTIVLTLVKDGNYVLTRSHRSVGELADQLPKLVKRESALLGLPEVPHTYFCATRELHPAVDAIDALHITRLGNGLWKQPKEQGRGMHRLLRGWLATEHRDAQRRT